MSRERFLNKYNPYMEFFYIYLNGEMKYMKDVYGERAHQFMLIVEYLIDKSRVENETK